jgi:hypothetical protein
MNFYALYASAVWVDFVVALITKYAPVDVLGGNVTALNEWYKNFEIAAAIEDILSLMIPVLLAQIFFSEFPLMFVAIVIQILHDLFFYFAVVLQMPAGHNRMIDTMKKYGAQGGGRIIVADSLMIASVVLIYQFLSATFTRGFSGLLGLLGTYAMVYIVYTK